MRALLLMGPQIARRERRLLARLGVGLADEGVGVVRAIPRSAPLLAGEPVGMFESRVVYADSGLPFTLGLRSRVLAARVAQSGPPDQPSVQIVHCWGERTWSMGRLVARELRAALVLELWRTGLAARAARLANAGVPRGSGERRAARARFMVLAADPAIADECAAAGLAGCVQRVDWGTHPDEMARGEHTAHPAGTHIGAPGADPLAATAPPQGHAGSIGPPCSVVLLTPARAPTPADAAAIRGALGGLAVAARAIPELLIFADADALGRTPIWRWAGEAGLHERFTLLADLEGQRALALRCDAVVMPCAAGEQRSFVLDAMADGVLVLAARDAANAALTSETALLVAPTPGRAGRLSIGSGTGSDGGGTNWAGAHAWADALVGLLTDRARAAALRESARRVVLANRRASGHVRAVVDVYEQLAYRVGLTQGLSDTAVSAAATAARAAPPPRDER